MSAGRPTDYTQEQADQICELIMQGKSLKTACKEMKIEERKVFRWLANPAFDEFRQQYARAREVQAEILADQIVDIADDSSNDTIEHEKFGKLLNKEWVERSKIRIDARKWTAVKLLPKKYGDKQQVDATVTGEFTITMNLDGADKIQSSTGDGLPEADS